MTGSLADSLSRKLSRQEDLGLKRELKLGREHLIDFASNDYLGLSRSAELSKHIADQSAILKLRNGSTGSRLLTGNSDIAESTEVFLSQLFKTETGLLFNSGYTANLAVLSSIPQKDDVILYDELAHASLKDGARLSLAKRFGFRHNDLQDLENKLKKVAGRTFIVVESVYSMDGDECPLEEICTLAEKYNASIILDEAHSTGLYAEGGAGLAVAKNLHHKIDIRVYTFGKAMGVHGAFVAGKAVLKKFMVNFARPFIYTTAPAPHSVIAIRCAFEFLKQNPDLKKRLEENIRIFLQHTSSVEGKSISGSAIQTLIRPGNKVVRELSDFLMDAGYDVRPILSPTVAKGSERLRICLHAFNSTSEVQQLGLALQNLQVAS